MQPYSHNQSKGFILVVCLVITMIVGLGSVALIRYSSSQNHMASMSFFQELARNEAHKISKKIFLNLQSEYDASNNGAAGEENYRCNALPNGETLTTECFNRSDDANDGININGSNDVITPETVRATMHYLGTASVPGNPQAAYQLYRIDVTVAISDWSVTQRTIVKLDR